MGRFTTTWSDDQVDDLKAGFAKGLSYTEIGRDIGKNRAAVASKCARMGLIQAPEVAAMNQQRLNPTYRKGPKSAGDPIRRPSSVAVSATPFDPTAFQGAGDGPTLLARRSWECAWPLGEPSRPAEQRCCGVAVTAKSRSTASYCDHHAAIATGNAPRRASRIGVGLIPKDDEAPALAA